MRIPMQRTASGAAVACLILTACGGGNGSAGFADSGADTAQPSHDATTPSSDAGDATILPRGDAMADGAHPADGPAGDGTAGHPDSGGSSDAADDHSAADALSDVLGDSSVLGDAGDASPLGSPDAYPGDAHTTEGGLDAHTASDAHGEAALDAQADATVDAGSDAAAKPPTFLTTCAGAHTTLTGIVHAPNGIDPIPSVRVYAAESINPYPTNYCDKCAAPIDPAYTATTTAVDGSFSLDLDTVPAGATIDFAIQIGRFRKHTNVTVTACQSAAVTPATATVLPGTSAAGDIPKIVVSSGLVDHLDVVLTALGITQYDCYEGRETAGSSTSTCQQVTGKNIADVIANSASLDAYNMAFLSCAPGAYAEFITTHSEATMNANTQSWVAGGGRIFVTDTAYDYIAQAFPSNIVWAGPAGTPQPVDGANIGCAPGGTNAHSTLYSATIDDSSLAVWLKNLGLASGTPAVVSIQGFYQPWSTISSLPASTSLIADAIMPINLTTSCTSPTMKDVPLTTQFEVPTCGRAVFSSFHTYTGTGVSAMAANEKIMEYLIFAAAVCSG